VAESLGNDHGFLSYRIRAKAKRRQVHYSFLFRASGDELSEITSLIDDGIVRPMVDPVPPFTSTKEAMAYVDARRVKGKVAVSLR
jgi:NADPH:quinone reductase-like Zn-dependent oxidoreductase